LTPDQYTAR